MDPITFFRLKLMLSVHPFWPMKVTGATSSEKENLSVKGKWRIRNTDLNKKTGFPIEVF